MKKRGLNDRKNIKRKKCKKQKNRQSQTCVKKLSNRLNGVTIYYRTISLERKSRRNIQPEIDKHMAIIVDPETN